MFADTDMFTDMFKDMFTDVMLRSKNCLVPSVLLVVEGQCVFASSFLSCTPNPTLPRMVTCNATPLLTWVNSCRTLPLSLLTSQHTTHLPPPSINSHHLLSIFPKQTQPPHTTSQFVLVCKLQKKLYKSVQVSANYTRDDRELPKSPRWP